MMRWALASLFAAISIACAAAEPVTLRVGVCAPTVSVSLAPFAVAEKLGYSERENLRFDFIVAGTSTDCAKYLATRQFDTAQFSIEQIIAMRLQGVRMTTFYTFSQGNVYGIAVPQDSAIKTLSDLKGKRIGVTSMSSVGVLNGRAFLATVGLNPQTDVAFSAAGTGAQAAALLNRGQVDAVSMFDTQFAMIGNAGTPLRLLPLPQEYRAFPTTGFVALESTLRDKRAALEALGRLWAMGSEFTQANPEAAVRMAWDYFPQLKPVGTPEEQALANEVAVLKARLANWDLALGGVSDWGESNPAHYAAYVDFLLKWKMIQPGIPPTDLYTNALVPAFNRFDQQAVLKAAADWKK